MILPFHWAGSRKTTPILEPETGEATPVTSQCASTAPVWGTTRAELTTVRGRPPGRASDVHWASDGPCAAAALGRAANASAAAAPRARADGTLRGRVVMASSALLIVVQRSSAPSA